VTIRAYVISDTHLGPGADDPLEAFSEDEAFRRFVGGIPRTDTTLYINGDFVDFVRIGPFDVPPSMRLLWDESTSLAKLKTAIKAHQECFVALKKFIADGGRLVLTMGNHDLDLAWPGVKTHLRTELGSPSDQQFKVVAGPDQFAGVHIEHGNSFTPENCPRNPQSPFCEAGDRVYLERVWGTDFMLQFYNDLEREHPYADNVKPMLPLAWAGLRRGWIGPREILRMLVFLKKRGIPWAGVTSATLGADGPLEPQMAAASFADGEWRQSIQELIQRDPSSFAKAWARAVAELSREERALATSPEAISFGMDGASESRTLGLFRDDRQWRAARDCLRGGTTAVVFGHTHEAVDGATVEGDLKDRLFNTGSWLPHLSLKSQAVQERVKRDGLTEEVLKDKSLYAVERWTAHIEFDGIHPAQVRLVSCDD
jgi:UDP-2,3-diacylglucosamine pyrophosphatase LpxH